MSAEELPADPADDRSRILVVDDHGANVVLTRRMLRTGGYMKVRAASDSRDALVLARTWHPDLVLVDLHMPHIGGTELILKLRSGEDPSPMAVLVLTGDDDPEALERARRAGADDCLVKPVDVAVLLRTVGRLLQR